jgi:L-aminoadipate-semialdehyde dehydrogenase
MQVRREKNSMRCELYSQYPHKFSTNGGSRMPLYHFATTDLPADTIAPEQSDVNTAAALRSDAVFTGEDLSAGSGPDTDILGNYLGYLAGIGFLPAPEGTSGRKLPEVLINEEQKAALLRVGGRGALV